MRLTIKDQMEISALLGIPMVDLVDKAEDFLSKIQKLVAEETHGPRQAVILMAVSYLYYVSIAANEKEDLLEGATRGILLASELFCQALSQETTP